MRNKERKIKATVSSKSKFSKKLQQKDNKNKPKLKKSENNENKYRPSWALDEDSHLQNGHDDINVEDIMDMVDHECEDDLISGYLNSIEKEYEVKTNRNGTQISEFDKQKDFDTGLNDADDDDDIEVEKDEEQIKNVYSDLIGQSYIENLVMIKKLKAKLQEQVALTSDKIMSYPMANINQLNKLFALLDTPVSDPEYGVIFFNVQQTVADSLCVIFNDIIPNYRLAERFNKKDMDEISRAKKQQLKKDTMQTYLYEKTLLHYYRLYLQRLQRMLGAQLDTSSIKSNFYKVMLTTKKARTKLAYVACFCLAELLSHHYNFNCRSEVIANLTKVLCNTNRSDDFMRNICSKAIGRLFKEDTLGEASVEAVNLISECVVKQNFRVPPIVFKTFLSLNFKELASDQSYDNQINTKNKFGPKKDRKMMSRKERKQNKHFSKLEKEMLEVEAVECTEKRYSHKVEIHKKIFALYFRFVKQCLNVNILSSDQETRDFDVWYRPLFPTLFQGIAQHSVFLNDVYIYELIKALLQLIEGDKVKEQPAKCLLASSERLCCLKTISQILSLSENLLTIDFQVPYIILYELSTDPSVIYESKQMLFECIEEMVIKRFKQLSFKQVNSFIQRLILLSLSLNGAEAIAVLTVIKRIFSQHQGAAESLFDNEESEQWLGMDRLSDLSSNTNLQGSGEANSSLIFHHLVHQHSDPYVRYLSYAIVTHYRAPPGRSENIADNKALANKAREFNLMPDLCNALVRSFNPMQAFNLVNEETVDMEQIFCKKSPTRSKK